jgi:rod shape-determining protein MreC
MINPLQNFAYITGGKINNYFQSKADAKNLDSENNALKSQINDLIIENTRLKIIEKENESLKAELSFIENNKYNYAIARIIGENIDNQSIIIINKGKLDGIKIGYPVVFGNGIMIGKIIKANDSISFALLLNDSQSKIAASILNTDNSMGVVEGEYKLSLKMGLLPKNQTINQDDIVITSGLESNIPKGLVIGKVNRLQTSTNDLFQTAIVNPIISYESINLVAVIIP